MLGVTAHLLPPDPQAHTPDFFIPSTLMKFVKVWINLARFFSNVFFYVLCIKEIKIFRSNPEGNVVPSSQAES